MKLQNKVALVTGAGAGIGRAITKRFLEEGARVMASDIHPGRLDSLCVEFQAAGPALTTTLVDVSKREDVEQWIDNVVRQYGRLDIAVNNAGIMDEFTPLADLDDDLWQRVLAVNLDGPMYVTRKALQTMLTQESGGTIVNLSSIGGLFGGRAGAAYTASKHGLIGLTRSVAYQYANKGIRANAICPGGVATEIAITNPNPLGYERLQTTLPMAVRMAQADELAATALFLASDESSFVNGAVLVADGGWTAG